MNRSFQAVGLSADFQVIDTRVVEPGRFVRFPACVWVLEIPADNDAPEVGQTLEAVDV